MVSFTEDTHPFPAADETAVNPWLIRLPILFISGALLTVLLLALLVAAFQWQYRDRIVPGVSALSIDLSGMTTEEAIAALDARFTFDDSAVFTFRDPVNTARFWQITARDLGVSFDVQATAVEAFAAGHSGSFISDMVDQALIWLNGHSVAPLIRYDQGAARARLEAIAREIDQTTRDATLNISGSSVQLVPGQSGRRLDVQATLNRLDGALLNLSGGGELPLAIIETPAVTFDAERAAQQAQAALSAPLVLVAEDADGTPLGPWTASVEQIAALLRVETVTTPEGGQTYEVTVDLSPFRAYLESMAQGLIRAPKDGRFHFNEETRQLEVFQPAVDGRTLDVDETLRRMSEAVFSTTNRVVPLAFTYTTPTFHNNITAAELGITEMVSQGISYYAGSTRARIDNIILATTRFDGIIVAPGEVFSFNEWVGDISPEEGFVEGNVIFGGRTIQGVGGGVCQVSTTAFRAAFYAGFPIVERHAHGYRVGFYERNDPEGVGMDAAIYVPDPGETGLDFKFLNDTNYHLLIETSIDPTRSALYFRFYSTNPGRQVIKQPAVVRNEIAALPTRYEINSELASGQELYVDWPAVGAYVEIERIILDAAGTELDRWTLRSQYQPWGAIVQVPPGDPRAGQTG